MKAYGIANFYVEYNRKYTALDIVFGTNEEDAKYKYFCCDSVYRIYNYFRHSTDIKVLTYSHDISVTRLDKLDGYENESKICITEKAIEQYGWVYLIGDSDYSRKLAIVEGKEEQGFSKEQFEKGWVAKEGKGQIHQQP